MPVFDNGVYSEGGEPDFTLDFMFVMGKDMHFLNIYLKIHNKQMHQIGKLYLKHL